MKEDGGDFIGGEIGKIVMVSKDLKDLIKGCFFEIYDLGEHVVNCFAANGS